MTEKEKNEKLLRFAGFTFVPRHSSFYGWLPDSWVAPSKEGNLTGDAIPDLYNDLNDQGEYLFPGISFTMFWPGKGNPAHAIAEATLAFLDSQEKVTNEQG